MFTFFKNHEGKKKLARCCTLFMLSLTVLISSVSAVYAGEAEKTDAPSAQTMRALTDPVSSARRVTVYIDGERYGGTAVLINNTTFVGIREFTNLAGSGTVSWLPGEGAALVSSRLLSVKAANGKEYIMSNGRYFWGREKNFIVDGTMYVPLRAICSSFAMTVGWNAGEFAAYVTRTGKSVTAGHEFYDADEVYWLSKIIEAESRGEPMLGKIAVGNVVLNRVASSEFPNTIYSVIFDRKYGVQFSPVADGSINLTPSEESVIAAKICLEGYTVSDSALYFINASSAQDFWVTNNRTYVTTIGNHDFYA